MIFRCIRNKIPHTWAIAPALRSAYACSRRSTGAAPEAHSPGATDARSDGLSRGSETFRSGYLPRVRPEQIESYSQDHLSAPETPFEGHEDSSPTLGAQASSQSRITDHRESGPMVSPKVIEQGNPALNGQQREVLPRPPKPSWLIEAQDEVGWHTSSDPEFDSWD